MITILFAFLIDIYNPDFEKAKLLYPPFGKVIEGKGYIPSIDFKKCEEIYLKNDDGKNPFIPLFLGELKRIKKEPFDNYYIESISRIKNLQEALIIDLVFIRGLNFKWSDMVKEKMNDLYEINNIKADFYISKIYEKKAIEERLSGNIKTSLYLISSSIDAAPMRREIALEGIKFTFGKQWKQCIHYFLKYIYSFKFINNSVFLIYNTFCFLITFILLIVFSFLLFSLYNGIFITGRAFSIKTRLKEFWIPGIFYSIVVFLPWKIFIPLFFLFSIIFLSRKRRIVIGVLFILIGLFSGYRFSLNKFLKDENNINILNSFYDPVNNLFESERKENYIQWLKGCALLKIEECQIAREVFKDLLIRMREKEKILNNIGVSFYIEGNYDSALYYFLETEKRNFPQKEYVYFNIAKTYAKLLDFPNSTKYFSKIEKLKGKKYEIYDFTPEEKEVYIKIFKFFDILNFHFLFSTGIGILLILFSIFFKKEFTYQVCSVCKSPALLPEKLDEDNIVCEKCFEKISFSQSKSLRKRVMRTISLKSKIRRKMAYIILNLFLPGSVHINNRFIFNGIFYIFIYNIFLMNLLGNFYNFSNTAYVNIHGSLFFILFIALYYILLIFSTGRIVEYGS
uniref:Uncharacterized protein n=1 Tax=candidate division WOR-3 bacterium TaxID=2052148 RepID=A0A7C4Y5D7_UNCW3